jgi:hypothetical protein
MMKERPDVMRRILLTGAAGAIGSVLAKQLPKENEIWRLNDIKQLGESVTDTIEHMSGDLMDYDFVLELCKDVDTIIHLAGQPKEGPWPSLLGPNVVCSANLWEAARVNNVKRIIDPEWQRADPAGLPLRCHQSFRRRFGEPLFGQTQYFHLRDQDRLLSAQAAFSARAIYLDFTKRYVRSCSYRTSSQISTCHCIRHLWQ